MKNDLSSIVDKFLNGELSANDIELMLNDDKFHFSFGDSIEYSTLTRPLNKKYREVTGNGIVFDLTKAYPSLKDCFICLLKAIETGKSVEYYYGEYWKNNLPEDGGCSEPPDNVFY